MQARLRRPLGVLVAVSLVCDVAGYPAPVPRAVHSALPFPTNAITGALITSDFHLNLLHHTPKASHFRRFKLPRAVPAPSDGSIGDAAIRLNAALLAEQWQTALTEALALLRRDPTNSRWLSELAWIYAKLELWGDALSHSHQAIQNASKDNPEPRRRRLDVFIEVFEHHMFSKQGLEAAHHDAAQIYSDFTEDREVCILCVRWLLATGNTDRARHLAHKIRKRFENDPRIHELLQRLDPSIVLDDLARVPQLSAAFLDARKAGDWKRAHEVGEELVRIEPHNATWQGRIAIIDLKTNHIPEALTFSAEAIRNGGGKARAAEIRMEVLYHAVKNGILRDDARQNALIEADNLYRDFSKSLWLCRNYAQLLIFVDRFNDAERVIARLRKTPAADSVVELLEGNLAKARDSRRERLIILRRRLSHPQIAEVEAVNILTKASQLEPLMNDPFHFIWNYKSPPIPELRLIVFLHGAGRLSHRLLEWILADFQKSKIQDLFNVSRHVNEPVAYLLLASGRPIAAWQVAQWTEKRFGTSPELQAIMKAAECAPGFKKPTDPPFPPVTLSTSA